MLERGLKPFATLYHWDLPSPLQDKRRLDEPRHRRLARRLCQRSIAQTGSAIASHATATINEPWCVAFLSHFLGIHAPGYRDIRAAARAMHHVLLRPRHSHRRPAR
jgi:beta-glucosidase